MGDWDIPSILGLDKSFVTGGNLGLASFPAVAGGSGNPADLAGNTASYVSISSHATARQKTAAEAFFQQVLASTSYAKDSVGAGEVPVIKNADGLFAGQQLSSYDQTIYTSVQQAPSFQYSWDQAVPPQEATPMLANLAQVFELTMTPQKFAATMDSQSSGG